MNQLEYRERLYSSELYHWGILGMKWGVRRYQNEDGSLTPAGKRRYGGYKLMEKIAKYDYKIDDYNKQGNTKKAEKLKNKEKQLQEMYDKLNKYELAEMDKSFLGASPKYDLVNPTKMYKDASKLYDEGFDKIGIGYYSGELTRNNPDGTKEVIDTWNTTWTRDKDGYLDRAKAEPSENAMNNYSNREAIKNSPDYKSCANDLIELASKWGFSKDYIRDLTNKPTKTLYWDRGITYFLDDQFIIFYNSETGKYSFEEYD